MPANTLQDLALARAPRGRLCARDAQRLTTACPRLSTLAVGALGIEYEIDLATGLFQAMPVPTDTDQTEVGYGGYAYPLDEVRRAAGRLVAEEETPPFCPASFRGAPALGPTLATKHDLALFTAATLLSAALVALTSWSVRAALPLAALAGVPGAMWLYARRRP
jgi:hypothetical protein